MGKKADLIILDENLFDLPVEEIPNVNVLATFVNGKIVFEEAVDWEPPKSMIEMNLPDFCGSCDKQHAHVHK